MKSQKILHILILASLFCLLTSGCGLSSASQPTSASTTAASTVPPEPKVTATEVLTETPTPTASPSSTPTETATPTRQPSATADRTGTAAARGTATAEALSAWVNPYLLEYGVNPDDGHIVWVNKQSLKLDLTSYMENADHVLKDAGKLADFVIQTEVTWDTSGALSLCGLTFSADDDFASGAQNRFFIMRLQYDPGWTIWRWEYGKFQSFVFKEGWRSSRDIHDDNGSSNLLALVVRGKDIDIFINRDKQRRVEDTKMKEGWLAFSANQESGKTTCTFRNSWVWAFNP